MKKIKINSKLAKQMGKKLNEKKEQPHTVAVGEMSPATMLMTNMQRKLKSSEFADRLAIDIIMSSHLLYQSFGFPDAPTQLLNLLQHLDMPGAFKNTKDLIPDPAKKIAETSDIAEASFRTMPDIIQQFMNNDVASSNVAGTHHRDMSTTLVNEGDLSYTPIPGRAVHVAVNPSSTPADIVVPHASGSFSLGMPNISFGGITAKVAPFAAGYAGVAAGAFGLGALAQDWDAAGATLGSELAVGQKKDPGVDNGERMQKTTKMLGPKVDVVDRIDNYISASLSNVQALITSIVGSKVNVSKFSEIINKLNMTLQNDVEGYLDYNNDALRTARERKLNDEKWSLQQDKTYLEKFVQGMTKEQIKDIIMHDTSLTPVMKKELEDKYVKMGKDTLSESFQDRQDKVQVDADSIYTKIYSQITAETQNMMAESDTMEWRIVADTRKRMEQMMERADKDIEARIKIVCGTGESSAQNAGLSSAVMNFLSKHPLQAEKLTTMWQGHHTDLQNRIEERCNHIISNSGDSPYMMFYTFITTSYPRILALMMTYKHIFLLIRNKQTHVKQIVSHSDEEFMQVAERESNAIQAIYAGTIYKNDGTLAYSYEGKEFSGNLVNFDNTPIVQAGIQNVDANVILSAYSFKQLPPAMPYLGMVMSQYWGFIHPNIIMNLHDQASRGYDEFVRAMCAINVASENDKYSKLSQVFHEVQPGSNIRKAVDKMCELFQTLSKPLQDYSYILQLIIASNGNILTLLLNSPDDLRQIIAQLNNDESNNNHQNNNRQRHLINEDDSSGAHSADDNIKKIKSYKITADIQQQVTCAVNNADVQRAYQILHTKNGYAQPGYDRVVDLYCFYTALGLERLNKNSKLRVPNTYMENANSEWLASMKYLIPVLNVLADDKLIEALQHTAENTEYTNRINTIASNLMDIININ